MASRTREDDAAVLEHGQEARNQSLMSQDLLESAFELECRIRSSQTAEYSSAWYKVLGAFW
jgi:hypothetical protein